MWRGWLRLYVVVSVIWLGWFGYQLYDAHKQRGHALDFLQIYNLDVTMHHPSAYNPNELGEWAGEQLRREQFAMIALPIAPVGLPALYFVGLWVWRGFRRVDA